MKFNRRKSFQSGGTISGGTGSVTIRPQIGQTKSYVAPIAVPQTVDRSNFKPDTSSARTINKEALKGLKAVGLTNAVNDIYADIDKANQILSTLTDLDIMSNSKRYQYATKLGNDAMSGSRLNEAKQDAEMFKTSLETMNKNKGGDAVLTKDGRIYVRQLDGNDKGKFKFITPHEYGKDTSKYELITGNRGMYELKEKDPMFSLDREIPTAAASTYGLEYINDYLDGQLANLGETKSETHKKELAKVSAFGNSYDGYKEWKRGSGSNKSQIASLNSTWNMLDENKRSQLRVTAIRNFQGLDTPQKIEDAAKYLMAQNWQKAIKTDYSTSDKKTVTDFQLDSGSKAGSTKTDKVGSFEGSARGFTANTPVTFLSGSGNKGFEVKMSGNIANLFNTNLPTIKHNGATQGGVAPLYSLNTSQIANFDQAVDFHGNPIDLSEAVVKRSDQDKSIFTYAIPSGKGWITSNEDPKLQQYQDQVNRAIKAAAQANGGNLSAQDQKTIETNLKRQHGLDNAQRVFVGEVYVANKGKNEDYARTHWEKYNELAEDSDYLTRIIEENFNAKFDQNTFLDYDWYKMPVIAPIRGINEIRYNIDEKDLVVPQTDVRADNPSRVFDKSNQANYSSDVTQFQNLDLNNF